MKTGGSFGEPSKHPFSELNPSKCQPVGTADASERLTVLRLVKFLAVSIPGCAGRTFQRWPTRVFLLGTVHVASADAVPVANQVPVNARHYPATGQKARPHGALLIRHQREVGFRVQEVHGMSWEAGGGEYAKFTEPAEVERPFSALFVEF